jgi:hypothetical protein
MKILKFIAGFIVLVMLFKILSLFGLVIGFVGSIVFGFLARSQGKRSYKVLFVACIGLLIGCSLVSWHILVK